MPDYVSRKKVSIVPFKDGNRAWQGKQNQEKKKRSCTRGLLVAACQRYLLRLAHVSNLFSSFSFGILSAVRIARARAHPCLSCDVYRLVGDNHRHRRALTEPITSIEAATVRQIIAIYFLVYLLSLFLGFPFLRSVALDSGYILCFSWVLVQAAVSCGREGIALKSLDSLSWSKAGITTQTTRKVRNTP